MNIKEIQKSKINSIDFDKLAFGQTFTDHMLICHYREGKWQTPEISPYKPLTLDPSSSVFHYGQAIFEGMKAYKKFLGLELLWLFYLLAASRIRVKPLNYLKRLPLLMN